MGNIIKVGIGVFVIQNNKILYGLRKSKHGENSYGPPGGHLEYGETIEECAVRELFEESGLVAYPKDVVIYSTVNEIYPDNKKHYISIMTIIKKFTGKLINKEPEKLEKWEWFSGEELKALGEKNFLPIQNFIKAYPDFDPSNL